MVWKYSALTKKDFEACSDYPKCNYIKGNELKISPIQIEEKCPECSKPLLIRFHLERGPFKACSNFPKCRKYGTKPIEEPEIKLLQELGKQKELDKYFNNIKIREEKLKAKEERRIEREKKAAAKLKLQEEKIAKATIKKAKK